MTTLPVHLPITSGKWSEICHGHLNSLSWQQAHMSKFQATRTSIRTWKTSFQTFCLYIYICALVDLILSYFIIMETTPLIDFAESHDEEKQWINDYCNDGEYIIVLFLRLPIATRCRVWLPLWMVIFLIASLWCRWNIEQPQIYTCIWLFVFEVDIQHVSTHGSNNFAIQLVKYL